MSLKSYMNRKLTRFVVRRSQNRYNRLFTWYFNIKYLPWKQAKYMPIAFYGHPRLLADEHQQIEIQTDKVWGGMIKINQTNESPCTSGGDIELVLKGKKIVFRGPATIGAGGKWVFYGNAEVVFGANILINNQVMIGSCQSVEIGDNVVIAHQCQIYDTDFHFMYDYRSAAVKNQCAAVRIGTNVWLANRVSVLKGACLPDGAIVTAGSLVNKDFSAEESATVFAGIPAVPTSKRCTLIRKHSPMLLNFFEAHPTSICRVNNAQELLV